MKKSSENSEVLISIVIPVKNGSSTLRSCLDGIFTQTLIHSTEVIVIDSGSSDGTLEILKTYPVKVHQIEPREFNHGSTRNLGVSLSKGRFVVMTVQDATPADDKWLETMLRHFDDPMVAGVCGQQIVRHDADKNPLQWFKPQGEADVIRYRFEDPAVFENMPGKEQHSYCNWDDVNAMYRKEFLETIPFHHISFGEDTLWARDALSAGYAIVYDYSARVYHYHHQNFRFYFKRTFIIHYQTYKFFNYIRFSGNVFKKLGVMSVRIRRLPMSRKEKCYWWRYNLNIIMARAWATWQFSWISRFRGMEGIEKALKSKVGLPPQGIQNKPKTV